MLVFEEDVLRLICVYAPQCVGRFEEKRSFYHELKGELDLRSADNLIMC